MAAVLLILFLVVLFLVFPIWVFVRFSSLKNEIASLRTRLSSLETQLRSAPSAPSPAATPAAIAPEAAPPPALPSQISKPEISSVPPLALPPPLSPPQRPISPPPPLAVLPPPRPFAPTPPALPQLKTQNPEPKTKTLNLEHFVGAKLFAWLGGLTAFLAVAFFVKYSFEHDLIPPGIRIAIGFALSAALIVAGLRITREKYRITSHVLCATGIVSLYAVTFASHIVYRFPFFTPLATFALMALITAVAFLLAVRLHAQVVAILGLLGGFLTPLVISTGEDNPIGLFTYVGLLDIGLLAVALHRRWPHLVPFAATGTVLLQIAWTDQFFTAARAPLLVALVLAFNVLFSAAAELARRWSRPSLHLSWTAAALALVALGFACFFLGYDSIATRPALLFGFVFAADAFLLFLAWRDARHPRIHLLGGAIVFSLLGFWIAEHLSPPLLPWALAACLSFAALHTAFPLVLQRQRPTSAPGFWSQLFPPLTLLLLLIPLFKLDDPSFLFWPVVLLIDALAVGLALLTGSLVAIAAVLVLSLVAAGVLIVKASATLPVPDSLFILIAVFAVFFFAAGLFLARRLASARTDLGRSHSAVFGSTSAQIPAFAALLPFILLILMSLRLALSNPTPLFGLALLLCVLVLALTRLFVIDWLPVCALAGLGILELSWHTRFFVPEHAAIALSWYAGFYALFAAFPFFFRRTFADRTGPWAVAAIAGIVHFPLIYDLIDQTWPNAFMGLVPAAFALAPLASLIATLRQPAPPSPSARLNQLAWFAGVALLFVTLIFPIQFERQWLTVAWALEGAALLWLFHRIPHPGLRATGVVLLVIVFARLALNPAVFTYHPRGDIPILNGYLYTYGLAILCVFVGARLLAPPRHRVFHLSAPALLNTFGVILSFLLLNLQIADFFSPPGATLTFDFSGNFARNLAYTVGWALFALVLLAAGIWKKSRAARIAAIALLGVTALKLFFHDLAELNQLYRVGALIAVAAVALVASLLYQRFAPSDAPPPTS